ncbi:MAG: hypothetical protein A2934_01980 [Candidatus Sungbacteria bacterium RIFCSPLOWO2_01_FULL_47_10]|uniref:Solute-binding protein family 5 domain-containing protein n=1 Tax=Candidatus Sungbacteria bacterium RIFCSPLOWO2_01_FULL_47_10 TaxID=1802276 RepID=A0A1G2L3N4_9BACT|nr:MAG: hypothetical protein A2934_01980 [Candidatus Sungbacteria bacterium RIFCSPLOWO2_01_FULL_47_10]
MTKAKIIFWLRRILYFPRLFSQNERILLFLLGVIFFASAGTFSASFILKRTVIVPARAGIFREGLLKQPHLINPLYLSNNDTDRDLVNLLFSSLITYDSGGRAVGDLAERWEASSDNTEFTFYLTKNASWHDGIPVTAEDVMFTVRAIQNPEYKSPLRQNWQGVSAEKIDDYTVRFILQQPYPSFMENAAVGILPEHLWGRVLPENTLLTDLNLKPVGSGKYVFDELKQNSANAVTKYILKANTNYYRHAANLASIEFSFYDSGEALIEAFKKNEIDAVSLQNPEKINLLRKEEITIYPLRLLRVFAVFLNTQNFDAFQESGIRKALSLAISRTEIIDSVFGGAASEINSPFPPGVFGHELETVDSKNLRDTDESSALLSKFGWNRNDDGILIKKEKKGKSTDEREFAITLVTPDIPELTRTADIIQKNWGEIGIKTKVVIAAVTDLEKDIIRPRAYDALIFGEVLGHEPDPFAFWHSSQIRDPGLNIAMFSNTKIDRILEDARREPDAEERKKKYQEFQRIVTEQYGALFLYSPNYYYAVRNTVKGIDLQNIVVASDRFNEIDTWYVKTKRTWKK